MPNRYAGETIDPHELPEDCVMVIVNALAMAGFPPPVPDAERRPCAACGRDTWSAPSSIAAEGVRETVYLCRSCGSVMATAAGIRGAGRLPGADDDARAPGSLVTVEGERRLAQEFPGS